MIDLQGKRALVTGGSRGIGAGICAALVASGASVVVNYHTSQDEAERVVTGLNTAAGREAAVAVRADISQEAEVGRMVEQTVQALGGLDILVSNAGFENIYPALELPMSAWDKVQGVNLRGAFMCAQAAARVMVQQGTGGVIVHNSSIHESVPRLGLVHYCAAKAGLAMLTKALALEWAEHRIRVVGVAPGAIETDMNRKEINAFGRERFEEWIPLHRLGTVEDVAQAVCFLASDAASYITGTTLAVDGAYSHNLVRYDPRTHLQKP